MYGSAPQRRKSVSGAIIDNIGFGLAQLKVSLLAGGVWAADGAEILLVSSTVLTVSAEWDLDATKRSLCLSLVFAGTFAGSILSGPIGDRLGRRLPILMSYVLTVLFSLISTQSKNFSQLAACRSLIGLSFGLGQPACSALVSEVTPAKWRTTTMSFLTSFLFGFGELYSVFLLWIDDPYMKHLHWRRNLALGCLPAALCFCLAGIFLIQSPSYLVRTGQVEEASKMLAALRSDNGAEVSQEDLAVGNPPVLEASWVDVVSQIFSKKFRALTLFLAFSSFTANMFLNGSFYIIPQLSLSLDNGYTPAFNLGMGVLMELPGGIAAVVAGFLLPKRATLLLSMVAAALTSAMMFEAIHSDTSGLFATAAMLVTKAIAIVSMIAVWSYAAEAYPGTCRTTGLGACLGFGRLGSVLAPIVTELTRDLTGSFAAYYLGTLSLYCINLGFGCLVLDGHRESSKGESDQLDPA
eukprot:TRINITY_DN8892_c0_g2_i1.p1 TRINITY_DN8892_c0_g2~~TRINITY_DN8892_c0_g2_i1.p1  ORF type:complete len:501 (+),score=59.67 TRINITY_DN8892_c0_g2_i1:107-1504(+)